MSLPLYPILLSDKLQLDERTLDALKSLHAPDAMTSPGDRFLGAMLFFASDAHRGARPIFPLAALVEMDEGQEPAPENIGSSTVRNIASPTGWAAWSAAMAALSADREIANHLRAVAADMMKEIAPIADAFSIPSGSYHDLVAVITPEGVVLYPEWLGEVARDVAYGPKDRELPSDLVRVMPCEPASAHAAIKSRSSLDDLVTQITRLTLFDGLITPWRSSNRK
jgi:hypothetical protein